MGAWTARVVLMSALSVQVAHLSSRPASCSRTACSMSFDCDGWTWMENCEGTLDKACAFACPMWRSGCCARIDGGLQGNRCHGRNTYCIHMNQRAAAWTTGMLGSSAPQSSLHSKHMVTW